MASLPSGPLAPIQTIPQGLLGLLQLKELGSNPRELLASVYPTIDILRLYLERLALSELAVFGTFPTTAAIATGNVHFVPEAQVPNNETWYVTQLSVASTTVLAAADYIRAAGAWGLPNTGGPYIVTPATADVASARNRYWSSEGLTQPFWAPPGTQFQVQVYDFVGSHQLQLSLRASRVPI